MRRPLSLVALRVAILTVGTLIPLILLSLTFRQAEQVPVVASLLDTVPLLRRLIGFAPPHMVALLVGYLAFNYVTVLLWHASPRPARAWVLFGCSALYFWTQISPSLTLKFIVGMGLLYVIIARCSRGWSGLVAYFGWIALFYTAGPWHELILPEGPRSLMGGFGDNVVVIGLFVRTFRRSAFAFHEARTGRLAGLDLVTFLNFQIGLPFLIGHSATPSLRHFMASAAVDDEQMRRTTASGTFSVLVCIGCLLLWFGLRWIQMTTGVSLTYREEEVTLSKGAPALWLMIFGWQYWYYLRRMATEQLSVGTYRLYGRDLKDDFAKPLLSRSILEYWRRWNALWREYLVSIVYYPVVLRLARRYGAKTPWIYAVAGFATFMYGTLFDFFPRLLFFVGDLDSGVWDFMLSLLLYHVCWACCLAVSLYLNSARGRGKMARLMDAPWMAPFQIALTLTIASVCRIWEIPWLTVADKLAVLRTAFGL
jgi:hypothetical protein